jgi:site-specific DNA recombinase
MVDLTLRMPRRRRLKLDPHLAVAGLRVSTDKKTQELGAAAQRAAIERWAKAQGVTVAAWHVDEASGAADLDQRPGLLAAMRELTALRAGILVFAKVDRLARDAAVAAFVERHVEDMGAKLAFADGSGAGGGPTGRLVRDILGSVATFERHVIRGRIKDALAVKAARGERVGSVPFGFRVAEDGVHLEPDPDEQRVLDAARELRAAGMSYPKIADELAARGFKSRGAKPLSLPTLWRALNRGVSR